MKKETTKENLIEQLSYEEIVQLRNVISNKEIDSSFIDKTSKIDEKPAKGFSVVVDDGIIPANPTGLTATAGIQFVFLQWTYNTETDMSHYEIWRNTTNNNATATKIAQTKANVFTDEAVIADTTYFYWIKAVDHLGNVSGFNATAGSSATPRNVMSGDIMDLAITNTKIADLAVNNAKISDLHGSKITAGTITAGKISVANLAAINANLGTVTAGTVRGLLIETNSGATTGIKMDNTSLRGYDGAGVKTFELVRATGALTLKGTIESGSNITGSTITGGTFQTAATGRAIKIKAGGSWPHRIQFNNSLGNRRCFLWMSSDTKFKIETIGVGLVDLDIFAGKRLVMGGRGISTAIGHDGAFLKIKKDVWNGLAGAMIDNIGHILPAHNNNWSLGGSGAKWAAIHRTNEFSCALPTSNCALDVIKRIKKPRIRKGDFGKRHYFEVKQFPKEMKANTVEKGKPEKLDIELTRTLGIAIQAIKELIMRIEKIENNIKIKI